MRTRRVVLGSVTAMAIVAAVVALTAQGQDRPPEPKFYQGKVSPAPPGLLPSSSVRPPNGQPIASTPPQTAGNRPAPQFLPAAQGQGSASPAAMAAGTAPRARITQPVVATNDGVQQAAVTDPSALPPPNLAGGIPSPSLPATAPTRSAPAPVGPPTVSVEQPGMAPNTPKPLNLGGAADPSAVPPPTLPPSISTPAPGPKSAFVETPAPSTTPATTAPSAIPAPLPTPAVPGLAPAPAPAPKPAFTEPSAVSAFPMAAPLPARQAPSVVVEAIAPDSIGVGQTLVYELVVRNVGTSPVANLRVEDELPARCTYVSSEPAAETTAERLSWTFGSLEGGAERRIKVTVKPGEDGEIRSRAVVTFAAAVDARVKVTRPKISVALVGPDSMRVGEKVPFQIKLSNTGSGPAGRVLLRAEFTTGLSHPQGQVIEAELAGLAAGQTKTLNLEAIGVKAGAQNCVLTATADGTPAETARAAMTLVEPMLTVKQTGPAKCLVRSEPVYQIELSNPGSATTDPIQLWASLPAGLELVQATDGGAFVEANRSVGWRLQGLPAGTTKTISLKVKAVGPVDGVIRTLAQSTPVPTDANGPGNMGVVSVDHRTATGMKGLEARAESQLKAEGVPALRFEVSDIEDPIEVGKEAIYEIRVVNQGTGPCTNVQLVADLSEGTSAAGATGPTVGRVSGQQIQFDPIPQFGVKGEAVYRVRVRGDQPGDLRFRVRLVCDQIKTPVIKEENTRFYKQ